jgi:hypothetical protein
MESFEHLCKVALEAEHFVVTGNVKFFVRRKTRKKGHPEYQEHGYEIDLVGARGDQLILAEVKSYFGSRGVNRQGFRELVGRVRYRGRNRGRKLARLGGAWAVPRPAC